MSNTNNVFTLEALDQEIERKYAPLTFRAGEEDFILVSLLRVDGKVREEVMERLASIDARQATQEDGTEAKFNEAETVADLEFVLSSVTRDKKGSKLVRALGHDLLRLMTMLSKWQEATQPGEAQGSPA